MHCPVSVHTHPAALTLCICPHSLPNSPCTARTVAVSRMLARPRMHKAALCPPLSFACAPARMQESNVRSQLEHINQMVQQKHVYTSRFRRYKV